MEINIVGIDCASNPANVGLAFGFFDAGRGAVERVEIGSAKRQPLDVVANWVEDRSGATLLALDAPLGWPAPLATALQTHAALELIDGLRKRMECDIPLAWSPSLSGTQAIEVYPARFCGFKYPFCGLMQSANGIQF